MGELPDRRPDLDASHGLPDHARLVCGLARACGCQGAARVSLQLPAVCTRAGVCTPSPLPDQSPHARCTRSSSLPSTLVEFYALLTHAASLPFGACSGRRVAPGGAHACVGPSCAATRSPFQGGVRAQGDLSEPAAHSTRRVPVGAVEDRRGADRDKGKLLRQRHPSLIAISPFWRVICGLVVSSFLVLVVARARSEMGRR
jgi:hypothetical protein